MSTTPVILYKYVRAEYALPFLREQRLKITPPIEFDDPFEFLPEIGGSLDRQRVENQMRQKRHEKLVYEQAIAKGMFVGSRKSFKREWRGKMGTHVNDAVKSAEPQLRNILKGFFSTELSRMYGILCLSEVRDSILMWSHYASGHRGIVIGIEVPAHWKMLRVEYGPRRAPIDIDVHSYQDRILEKLIALAKTKSDQWSYEKEWRGISVLSDLEAKEQNGKIQYFAKLPIERIKEVIVGLRYPSEDLPALQAAQQRTLPRAKLLKATLHDNAYELVIDGLRVSPIATETARAST